jgi:predicted ester cyclase
MKATVLPRAALTSLVVSSFLIVGALLQAALAQDSTTTCPFTTEAQNEQLIRRYIREASSGNGDIVDEVLHPQHTDHAGRDVETVRGRIAGGVPYPFRFDVTIEQLIAKDNYVVVYSTARATHDAEFAGVAPTGQEVVLRGMAIFRIECGRVIDTWNIADNLSLLQQVGAVPSLMEGAE